MNTATSKLLVVGLITALSCGFAPLHARAQAPAAQPPAGADPAKPEVPDPEMVAKVKAALPSAAPAKPKSSRKLLVFTLTKGYRHSSIPIGAEAIRLMGEKTGAYAAQISDDLAMFAPQNLAKFDAVLMLSTTGELFDDAELKKSVLEYVSGGKGWMGIHAATDCFYNWTQYGEMIGGYFDGHPWHEKVAIKIDDPKHPCCAAFEGKPLDIVDEIYQFKAPYSRDKLHILTSLDVTRTDMSKDGIHRTDGDFAVSWLRNFGKGRVFNCSLGHREEIYWNPIVLKHYLAGIQFVLGDLEADATPSTLSKVGWMPLFNGKDLTGWKGLVGDPKSRAAMSREELAAAQAQADEQMRQHWSVEDGVLVFDGHGSHLCTAKDYADFEMMVDWKIDAGGDSGVYLRGSPQVQIWDPAQWPEGSGGLYNNQKGPNKPLVKADNPIGEWNSFHITIIGDRVTVDLNGRVVVDDIPLENYWERDKPLYPTGQIELQSHGSRLCFRNLYIREFPTGEPSALHRMTAVYQP